MRADALNTGPCRTMTPNRPGATNAVSQRTTKRRSRASSVTHPNRPGVGVRYVVGGVEANAARVSLCHVALTARMYPINPTTDRIAHASKMLRIVATSSRISTSSRV
jgi:hypothetical protein